MEERIDELKGTMKEGVGRVTDNEKMEAEGRGEREVARAERNIKGAGDQIKGAVERGVGKLTDDEGREAEGRGTQLKGDIERTG